MVSCHEQWCARTTLEAYHSEGDSPSRGGWKKPQSWSRKCAWPSVKLGRSFNLENRPREATRQVPKSLSLRGAGYVNGQPKRARGRSLENFIQGSDATGPGIRKAESQRGPTKGEGGKSNEEEVVGGAMMIARTGSHGEPSHCIGFLETGAKQR